MARGERQVRSEGRSGDEQIERTFRACGFPNPVRAESVRDLRDLLSGPSGRTVMTTVQKFQEALLLRKYDSFMKKGGRVRFRGRGAPAMSFIGGLVIAGVAGSLFV